MVNIKMNINDGWFDGGLNCKFLQNVSCVKHMHYFCITNFEKIRWSETVENKLNSVTLGIVRK